MKKRKSLFNDFEYTVLAGIGGFIVAFLILTFNGSLELNGNHFREIRMLNARESVIQLLKDRDDCYTEKKIEILAEMKLNKCTQDSNKRPSCALLLASLQTLEEKRNKLQGDLYGLEKGKSDSLPVLLAASFFMSPDKLKKLLDTFSTETNQTLYPADNSLLKGNSLSTTITFNSTTGESLVGFVDRNPSLGYWVIITLAQTCMWFVIATLLFGSARTGLSEQITVTQFMKSLIIPVLAVLVFILPFYYLLIDSFIFPDAAILTGFGARMMLYAIIGYAAAVVCFATYISAAAQLGKINKRYHSLLDAKATAETKTDATETKTNATETKTDAAETVETGSEDDKGMLDQYKKMETLFNGAFISSAAILSLFILWLAFLFNGINGMETMRYYTLLSNKPFINGDFVYMVALFHSILLLLFYVPVKLKFNSMTPPGDAGADNGDPKKFLKFTLESLGTILITASPLITSLIEKSLSNFF